MNRLKVTAAKQNVPQKVKAIVAVKARMPEATKAKVVDGKKCVVATVGKAAVKMPAATTAKVAEIKSPVIGKVTTASQIGDKSHEAELVKSCMQTKLNNSKPNTANKTNTEIIEQYRAEYTKFLKELEKMDFGDLVFGQKEEKKVEKPTEALKVVDKPKPVEEPKAVETPKVMETPKSVEPPKEEPVQKVAVEAKPEINLVQETVESVPLGDFVNGISVGEEAGDEIVVPVKKTRRRKKSVIAESNE